MFEVKITIEATALAQAINNLAAALSGAMPCQTPAQPQTVANPMPQQAAPAYPGQPQASAPGNPASPAAAPAPTVDPGVSSATANTAPVAAPAANAQPTVPVAQAMAQAQAYPSSTPASASAPMHQQAAPAYPGQTPPPAQNMTPVSGVPLSQPPQYTFDQIQKAGATLMDAGRVDDLMNLLHSFGVNAITDLRPELLGAFATALRGLGAKI